MKGSCRRSFEKRGFSKRASRTRLLVSHEGGLREGGLLVSRKGSFEKGCFSFIAKG